MDDDLGDLDDIMGDDYQHGYDESAGDPNVKPKVRRTACMPLCKPEAWLFIHSMPHAG